MDANDLDKKAAGSKLAALGALFLLLGQVALGCVMLYLLWLLASGLRYA